MKKIFILLSVAFFGMFGASAQAPVIYTKMTAAGYEFKYLKIDSGLLVPSRDTLVYRNANQPGIIVYKPGSGFFGYNGTNWNKLVGVDTTSLSNRINTKLNIVDTANIRFRPIAGSNVTLSGTYPNITINAASQSTDTSSLSNRINQKLNIVDTANVRVRLSAGTNITSISGTYPNLTINAGNQSTDTSSLSNRINQKLNIADTANVRVRLSAGTNITSISGTYPNLTINADNQSIDTSSLSNRINQKLNTSDTANIRFRPVAGANITLAGSYPNITFNATSTTVDTSSLSNRINQKLNIADTANKWVTNVTTLTDSSFNVSRAGAVSTITIKTTGQATNARRLVTQVYNNTGTTIAKGSVVYINGRHSSNLPTIALAQANDEANSYKTFALVENDIATSNSGTVIQAGNIGNLNLPTSIYADGDILYLSPTVAGGYTTTKPIAPDHICKLGSVTRAHPTFGQIETKIENGWELMEMSDVQLSTVPADSALLQFSRVDSLWHDRTITQAIGPYLNAKQDASSAWKTVGNTVGVSDFIGSNNNAPLRFKTNGENTMVLDSIGRLQVNGLVNNTTYANALQLANKNARSVFNVSTTGVTTHMSIKANNNAVGDSLVIADTGLIQPRSNSAIWLKGQTTGAGNVNVNAWRSGSAGTGSIFSANVGTNAPIFNMLSTGQMSIGAETPASTAALDITSTSRGLLIPRMTTTTRNAIGSPSQGLMIWNTTDTTLNQYTGNTWRGLVGYNPSGTIDYTAPTQTGSNANGIMTLNQTWNTTGNVNGLAINITNTASGTNSRIFDVVVSGSREFVIDRNGTVGAISTTRYQGFSFSAGGGSTSNATYFNCTGSNSSNNAGTTANGFQSAMSFSPSSNNAVFNNFSAIPTINQTGTASGISRGLFVNPTLTSAVDFRAIEATNGSIVLPYATAAATYAIKTSDYLLNCTSGTFTATLPTAVGCTGKNYVLKNSGTGTITIATTSSQTIDGATTYSLNAQYKYVHVVSNGANWIVIANN